MEVQQIDLEYLKLLQMKMDNVLKRHEHCHPAYFKESQESLIEHFKLFADDLKLIHKSMTESSNG